MYKGYFPESLSRAMLVGVMLVGRSGVQGYASHLSANPFENLREVIGFGRFVCLSLRIGAPSHYGLTSIFGTP